MFTKLDLEAALAVLTPKQKAAFLLFADGKTYREIAQELGVSLPTVQQHITAARRKLKKILGDTIQTP